MLADAPRSIDGYVAAIARCHDTQDLFAIYAEEAFAEGFDSIFFARLGPDLEPCEMPFACAPTQAASPLEAHALSGPTGFYGSVVTERPGWLTNLLHNGKPNAAGSATATMSICVGPSGELTMPFRGPDGSWDIVTVTARDNRIPPSERISIVNLKTYATMQRLNELAARSQDGSIRAATNADPVSTPHAATKADAKETTSISDAEGRALVLVDIAWRRYRAGLLGLNKAAPDIIGDDLLDQCMLRGLMRDEPDDYRFQFVLRLTPAARRLLTNCNKTPMWREEVLSKYVDRQERPED